jgi:hypothetical protein
MRTVPGHYGTLKGQNLAELHRHVAHEYARVVCRYPDVVGAVLLGGAARGFADRNSDIDIVLFTSCKEFAAIRRGEQIWRGNHLDVSVVHYQSAASLEWTMDQRSAYADAILLHDSSGRISRLLKRAVTFPESERKLILIDRIMRIGWYGINYRQGDWRGYCFFKTPDFWLLRGDPASAHHILNYAIDMLLDALFAYNRVLIPDEKWKLHLVYSLRWVPANFRKRLSLAMSATDMSEKVFKRRLRAFSGLLKETVAEVERRGILPQDMYRYLVNKSDYWTRP